MRQWLRSLSEAIGLQPKRLRSSLINALLIANRRRRAVELFDIDRERFVIGLRPILQDTERHLFAQKN
jgi:hypothetical protein